MAKGMDPEIEKDKEYIAGHFQRTLKIDDKEKVVGYTYLGAERLKEICEKKALNIPQQMAAFFVAANKDLNLKEVNNYINNEIHKNKAFYKYFWEELDLQNRSLVEGLREWNQKCGNIPDSEKYDDFSTSYIAAYREKNPSMEGLREKSVIALVESIVEMSEELSQDSQNNKVTLGQLTKSWEENYTTRQVDDVLEPVEKLLDQFKKFNKELQLDEEKQKPLHNAVDKFNLVKEAKERENEDFDAIEKNPAHDKQVLKTALEELKNFSNNLEELKNFLNNLNTADPKKEMLNSKLFKSALWDLKKAEETLEDTTVDHHITLALEKTVSEMNQTPLVSKHEQLSPGYNIATNQLHKHEGFKELKKLLSSKIENGNKIKTAIWGDLGSVEVKKSRGWLQKLFGYQGSILITNDEGAKSCVDIWIPNAISKRVFKNTNRGMVLRPESSDNPELRTKNLKLTAQLTHRLGSLGIQYVEGLGFSEEELNKELTFVRIKSSGLGFEMDKKIIANPDLSPVPLKNRPEDLPERVNQPLEVINNPVTSTEEKAPRSPTVNERLGQLSDKIVENFTEGIRDITKKVGEWRNKNKVKKSGLQEAQENAPQFLQEAEEVAKLAKPYLGTTAFYGENKDKDDLVGRAHAPEENLQKKKDKPLDKRSSLSH